MGLASPVSPAQQALFDIGQRKGYLKKDSLEKDTKNLYDESGRRKRIP
jgi:hypothetical protein